MVNWITHPEFSRYQVSEEGAVIGPRGTVMKWQYNKKNGYYWLKIQIGFKYARVLYVHDLVCTAFHGERPIGMEVRHLDGDRSNNSAVNLCWGTHQENADDMIFHGRPGGPRKATVPQVFEIRSMKESGISTRDICRKYGLSQTAVDSIIARRTWKHVP